MKKTFFVFILSVIITFAFSQETLKSTEDNYYDFLTLTGNVTRNYLAYKSLDESFYTINTESSEDLYSKPLLDNENLPWNENNLGTTYSFFESDAGNNWFSKGFYHGIKVKLFGPRWFNSINTNLPFGQNDGALWQGKGYNTSLSAGVKVESFGFELTFKPVLTFSQNLDFYHLNGSYNNKYSYFNGPGGGSIDLVQRYGEKSFINFDFGDSELRYTFHNFTVGFGNQAVWLGPAILNPMLSSNNAGTYPKFDFGLRKTKLVIPGLGWDLGDFEFRIWIGQLTQSDYFNYYIRTDIDNSKNLINGFNISYSLPFFRNLVIGATKVCITKWGNNFWKYINPFYSDNDIYGIGEDQKMSAYLDLLFPSVGFELFGEFGLDDFSSNWKSNPFHTMIFTVGGKKSITFSKKNKVFGEFYCEANFFEPTQDFQLQWDYTGYYSHGQITQGYTQNGQLLAAGSGYFGNSQLAGLKVYFPLGSVDFYFHRNCPDNSYIYKKSIYQTANEVHDYYADYETYFNFGLTGEFFLLKNLILKGGIVFSYIECFRFDYWNNSNNWNFNLEIKYNF